MNSRFSSAIVATSLLAAMPLTAYADETAAVNRSANAIHGEPIQVNTFTIQPSAGWQNNFAYAGITVIEFTNQNASPATDVVFSIRGYQGRIIARIEDAGNYTQGEHVHHSFINNDIDPNETVVVEEATFADGSVWTSSMATVAPVSRRQAR